jgi:glycosidase
MVLTQGYTFLTIRLANFPPDEIHSSHTLDSLPYEFHILSEIRLKYEFDETLYLSNGNVIFANFNAVRIFAKKINDTRDLIQHPDLRIKAGHLNAMGLIDEIYHYVLRLYEETANPNVFSRAVRHLGNVLGKDSIDVMLRTFGSLFPPKDVYSGKITLEEYITGTTVAGKPNTEVMIEELIVLYFANFNPAFAQFNELFHDEQLREHTAYAIAIEELEKFFQHEKRFGPENQYIFDLLRAPILASPHNLEGQLAFIKSKWGLILSEKYLRMMLGANDLILEETKVGFHSAGEIQTAVPNYRHGESGGYNSIDYERFTTDIEWMPNVVIIAKNTYVWLDQLSKKYNRSITKLNEIPDEELDQLARWNFSGLWLIGIWERSPASQKIKQMTGNPEAVSSAYSVYDYEIAGDLGGEEAFQNLRRRAWERGIRLAGDMVPNHMGICSRWVIEHPDYFIQSSYSPFPNYHFTGSNLSNDPTVDLRIEDGYWTRTDAAVVFQRIDNRSGQIRYLYHGNDGTNMPWNDTAQLNFLRAEVREAVIQTIFHVARKFSIIRFDAAMTLAKKHFQRLWYPQPGSGGDIPSRADHAMMHEEFEKCFPREFWREVVDRINAEMPSTLLLAEAFWLLEGYFVRTLGMHRVYNSAFMHMLTKEENAKYRELIRNTLHYNPEILKRYVNFMSNPDEQTAVAQFGKDDKYFGVAVLMVTLPGLPMFAHGQIEGYGEKYGMEYKRAYHDEIPDEHLVRRHERDIFPLMAKRHLFAHVENFELYDFIDTYGHINENVFAFSNKARDERSLICYHNKYEETAGWVKVSVGKTVSRTDDPNAVIVIKDLAQALEVDSREKHYYIFREYNARLEFIRSGKELHERGVFVELKAFQCCVFLDFKEVYDERGEYGKLAVSLNGRGVQNIDQALKEMQLSPVHDALRALFSEKHIHTVVSLISSKEKNVVDKRPPQEIVQLYKHFAEEAAKALHCSLTTMMSVEKFGGNLLALKSLREIEQNILTDRDACIFLGWIIALSLIEHAGAFEQLQIDRALSSIFTQRKLAPDECKQDIDLIIIMIQPNKVFDSSDARNSVLEIAMLLNTENVRRFLKVNEYNGITYYSKESFELLMQWLLRVAMVQCYPTSAATKNAAKKVVSVVQEASILSEYKFDQLIRILKEQRSNVNPEVRK